ncbi:hypothetical protein FQN52_001915 [Onygenales sp. PD_12]|nr:hypothetical protein FQN52_001915 [Onygenales sp. PD_12]
MTSPNTSNLCTVIGQPTNSFDTSTRPTDDHIRAILFPVDEKRPKLIWLHCEWHDDEYDGRYQSPEARSFLGSEPFPKHIPIQYNQVLKRALVHTLNICCRDTFLIDGSKTNNSIAAITATKLGQYHDWRGPIVAYGRVGLGIDQPKCKDLDMNDFRHITDYFLSYGYEPAPAAQQSIGINIKGVKINCIGDQKMFNKPHFEAVEVPSTDPIFSKHDTSDIAKRIGLPIFTRRCPPDPQWADDNDNKIFENQSPFDNQDATFLHLCCDARAAWDPRTGTLGWSWAPQQWQNNVGSAIVVRQDKKPLSPLHVEALCKYCRYEIRPLLAHSIGEYSPEEPMRKDEVLTMICRPTFIIYWYKLLDEKCKEGEDTSVPSPYDM